MKEKKNSLFRLPLPIRGRLFTIKAACSAKG